MYNVTRTRLKSRLQFETTFSFDVLRLSFLKDFAAKRGNCTRRRKIYNKPSAAFSLPQIDKTPPLRRNLISALSFSLRFSLSLSISLSFSPVFFSSFHREKTSRFLEADFYEDTSYGISTWLLSRAGIFHACRPLRTDGRMRRTSREIFTHAIPVPRKFHALLRHRSLFLREDAVKMGCTKVLSRNELSACRSIRENPVGNYGYSRPPICTVLFALVVIRQSSPETIPEQYQNYPGSENKSVSSKGRRIKWSTNTTIRINEIIL